ncbi:hypothetical protein BWQ96_04740 [Gracilariopsis chorda]|uniref:Uncharacterized protein n=1 Tax=Gracilariopsis chorda TaxID=448386 RepID=A0A2V3ITL7_9FLOR|nr:hypothetical protein BWQ96_04740 [Gracilariopsis chorda]|eukprot:PXF45442.1 hypothetical protein BWQ96_04740 [Gracilariopsis chorda]
MRNASIVRQRIEKIFLSDFSGPLLPAQLNDSRELHSQPQLTIQPLNPFNIEALQKQALFAADPVAMSEVLEDGTSPTLPSSKQTQLADIVPAAVHEDEEHHSVSMGDAVRFFDTQISQCLCIRTCAVTDMMELAKSFALLSETDNINTVHAMLLAVTSRQDETNKLLRGDTTSRKRTRRTYEDAYCTTRYCVRGEAVCRTALSVILQIHPLTVNPLGKMLESSEHFQLADGGANAN